MYDSYLDVYAYTLICREHSLLICYLSTPTRLSWLPSSLSHIESIDPWLPSGLAPHELHHTLCHPVGVKGAVTPSGSQGRRDTQRVSRPLWHPVGGGAFLSAVRALLIKPCSESQYVFLWGEIPSFPLSLVDASGNLSLRVISSLALFVQSLFFLISLAPLIRTDTTSWS